MKTIIALAGASLLALTATAYAQDAGAPGAIGTGGSLTGSNIGTSGPNSNRWNDDRSDYGRNGYMDEGRAAAPDFENGDGRAYGENRDMYGSDRHFDRRGPADSE